MAFGELVTFKNMNEILGSTRLESVDLVWWIDSTFEADRLANMRLKEGLFVELFE